MQIQAHVLYGVLLLFRMLRGVAGISPAPAATVPDDARQPKKGSSTTGPGARRDSTKYSKLLRDLEGDSVDTEILDEELRFLKEIEPKT